MKFKFYSLAFFIGLLGNGSMQAQATFTNRTQDLGLQGNRSGVAIAVLDINGDGRDDVARLAQGRNLELKIQQANGSFQTITVGSMSNESQWAMVAGDLDNNGYVDFMSGGSYDNVKVAMANANGTAWTISQVANSSIFVQGSNFADINNDGFLDIFACHDDGPSRIWGNNGNGTFSSVNWINLAPAAGSDNSGNYGSVWCDFDNDGDLDLYIAKCRQGVNSPTDPRRINILFENDGNNNYTENGAARGLRNGAQSWTADFADIDNDGDFDCFITNHDVPSQLMINDGNGNFTDGTTAAGLDVTVLPIQGMMKDFDNDGWVDILVAGSDEQYFHNDGDGTFTEITGMFNNNDMESYAIGDLNHDGFLDIYAGYANIYTTPSSVDDAVWMNNGNSNHFVAVNLQGTVSNRSAVGARVEAYGPWGIQIREVRAGESYGIVNSFTQNFGLGSATTIDSIIVRWPSGIVDVVTNPGVDQFITIIENTCVSPNVSIAYNGPLAFCTGQSLDLTAPAGFNYLWSNGATTQTISVAQAGTYSVAVSDNSGCSGTSSSLTVEVDPIETPVITADAELTFCEGNSVTLTATPAQSYLWSNGATTASIEAETAGTYSVQVQGLCNTFTSNTLDVVLFAAPAPTASDESIALPAAVTLNATGNDLTWYDAPTGGNVLGTGPTFTTPVLSTTTNYYVGDRYQYGGDIAFGGMINHSGNSAFSGNTTNARMIFSALEDVVLVSVKVTTDNPGVRIIELQDAVGNVLQSVTANIPTGTSRVTLNFAIPQGTEYYLTTNTAQNNTSFGYNAPRLRRNNSGVTYPYDINGLISINDSDLGAQYYYYFYDWEVQAPFFDCISERTEVTVQVTTGTQGFETANAVRMFPNPADEQVSLELNFEENGPVSVMVTDIAGRQVQTANLDKNAGSQVFSLNTKALAAGVYMVQVTHNQRSTTQRLVIE